MTATVKMSTQEMYLAGVVGLRRNIESIHSGRKPRFPESVSGELFGFHILGAMAEMVVAKYLDKYWECHINHFESGDLGEYEIRYSMRSDLKIRERDTGIVISVTGKPPEFIIAGWADASEAKKKYTATSPREGPPAYFVPHADLQDVELLKR